MKAVTIRVALPKGDTAKSVTLASPEHGDDLTLPFTQQPGVATFTVPTIGTYEIAIVTYR